MVAEANGYKEAIDRELTWKLQEMAKIRGLDIESIQNRSGFIEVPKQRGSTTVQRLRPYVAHGGLDLYRL
jgi:hypothetical protein